MDRDPFSSLVNRAGPMFGNAIFPTLVQGFCPTPWVTKLKGLLSIGGGPIRAWRIVLGPIRSSSPPKLPACHRWGSSKQAHWAKGVCPTPWTATLGRLTPDRRRAALSDCRLGLGPWCATSPCPMGLFVRRRRRKVKQAHEAQDERTDDVPRDIHRVRGNVVCWCYRGVWTVWSMYGLLLHDLCFRYRARIGCLWTASAWCMHHAWIMYWMCVGSVWDLGGWWIGCPSFVYGLPAEFVSAVPAQGMDYVWMMSGQCMGYVPAADGLCMGCVWVVFWVCLVVSLGLYTDDMCVMLPRCMDVCSILDYVSLAHWLCNDDMRMCSCMIYRLCMGCVWIVSWLWLCMDHIWIVMYIYIYVYCAELRSFRRGCMALRAREDNVWKEFSTT